MSEDRSDVPKPAIPKPSVTPVAGSSAPPLKNFEPPSPKPVVNEVAEDADAEDGVPFSSRVVAGVIDMLIAGGIGMTVQAILPNFLSFVGTLAAVGYVITRDSLPFLNGQSIGKSVMKFRVVTRGGKSLEGNWRAGVIRNAALIILPFAIVEFVVLLTREDKPEQGTRLGDEWAKTMVEPALSAVTEEKDPEA